MEENPGNRLTCTSTISTLVHDVDATTKKLLKQLESLEWEKARIGRDIDSIRTALSLAGVKPPNKFKWLPSTQESNYRTRHTFADMSLAEACLMILKDHKSDWLSKSQIEYLIVRGGYKFSTKDSKNSVGVTLQRLKDDRKCEVERVRGAHGNRYRWLPERNTDATSAE
jgi:hypothetical protein